MSLLVLYCDINYSDDLVEFLQVPFELVPTSCELFNCYDLTGHPNKGMMPPDVEIDLGDSTHIVMLGAKVFSTLGPEVTLAKDRGKVFDWRGRKVLISDSPTVHFHPSKMYRKNLTDTYLALAGSLISLLGGPPSEDLSMNLEIFERSVPLSRVLKSLPDIHRVDTGWMALDIETAESKKNKEYAPVWGPKSAIICLSFSWYDLEDKKYRTSVVDTTRWESSDYKEFLEAMRPYTTIYSNAMFDMTYMLNKAGIFPTEFDGTPYAAKLREVRSYFPKWEDSYVLSWLKDQSSRGNGLKGLATANLQAKDWSKEFWAWMQYVGSEGDPPVPVEYWGDAPLNKSGKPMRRPRFKDADWHLGKIPYDDAESKAMGAPKNFPQWNDLLVYNAYDTYWQIRVWREVCAGWEDQYPNLIEVYPFLKRVCEDLMVTQWVGFPYDMEASQHLSGQVADHTEKLNAWVNQELSKTIGKDIEFNAKSPQQKSDILDALGISEGLSRTDGGGMWQVNKAVLQKLSTHPVHGPIISDIKELTEMRDLSSKFLNVYENNCFSDRLRFPFYVCKTDKGGTDSGRLANPLHNFPKGAERVARLARAKPFRGCANPKFLISDLKSIEPVVFSSLANCVTWLELFDKSKKDPTNLAWDVYRDTWSKIELALGRRTDYPPEAVKKPERDGAKVVVLGKHYDRGIHALKTGLGCSYEEAKQIFDNFDAQLPEFLQFAHNTRRAVIAGNTPKTIFGRYRSATLGLPYIDIPEFPPITMGGEPDLALYLEKNGHLNAKNSIKIRGQVFLDPSDAHELRAANNNLIQSAANDINLYAKLYMAEHCPEDLWHIMTIHDSIIFLGNPSEENLEWVSRVHSTPSLWLPQDIMEALNWDTWDVVQSELTYGDTRYQEDHTKYVRKT